MATVIYKGNTYNYPDGMDQNAVKQSILSGQLQPTSQATTTPQTPATAPESNDGSILGTIGAGWNRIGQNILAATTDDADLSRYQLRKAQQANTEYSQERGKLGTIGGVVADVGQFAPVVAAGMVNPVLGAAAMGGMTTGEALAEQAESGSRYDVGSAVGAGIESAAVDYATAGLGGKFIKGVAPGLKRLGAETATAVAQPAVSNMNAQVALNVASGKPWNENVGEAGVVGAVTGGVLHGGAKSLRGLPEALGIKPNAESAKAAKDAQEAYVDSGFQPNADFHQSTMDYAKTNGHFREQLDNTNINDVDTIGTHAQAITQNALDNGSNNVVQTVAKMYGKAGMPAMPHMWDVDVGSGMAHPEGNNVARNVGGMTAEELRASGEAIKNAKTGFLGTTKAIEEGATTATSQKRIQDSFFKIRDEMTGSASHNTNLVDAELRQLGSDSPLRGDYANLRDALGRVSTMVDNAIRSGKRPDLDSIRNDSVQIFTLGKRLGMLNKFKGADGSTVGYNPVEQVQSALLARETAMKGYTGINEGAVDIYKTESKAHNPLETAVTVGGGIANPYVGGALALRQAIKEFGAARGRKTLLTQRAKGEAFTRSLADGDSGMAAAAAEGDLKANGINTGEHTEAPQEAPQTAQETTSTQGEPNAQAEPQAAPEGAQAAPEGNPNQGEFTGEGFERPEPEQPVDHEEDVMGGLRNEIANPTGSNPQETALRHSANKALHDQIETSVNKAMQKADNKGYTRSDIFKIINERGGIDALRKAEGTMDFRIGNMITDAKKTARAEAADHQKSLDEEDARILKENAGKDRAESIKNTEALLKEGGIPEDVLAQAHRELKTVHGEGEYTAQQLLNKARQLHQPETVVPDQPTMADSRARLERHARELGVQNNPEIKAFIDEKVRPGYGTDETAETGMRSAPMRTAMARISKMAETAKRNEIAPKEFENYANSLGVADDKFVKDLVAEMHLKFKAKRTPGLESPDLRTFITKLNKYVAFQKEAMETRIKNQEKKKALTEAAKKERKANSERLGKLEKAFKAMKDENEVLKGVNEKTRASVDALIKKLDEQKANTETFDKAQKKLDEGVEKAINEMKDNVHKSFADKTQAEIDATVEHMDNNPPEGAKGYSDPKAMQFIARLRAASEDETNPARAKMFRIEASIYEKAFKRMEQLGDKNKSLLISKTDMHELSEAIKAAGGNEGSASAYYGNKYEKIRLALFGSTKTDYVHWSESELKSKLKQLESHPELDFDRKQNNVFRDESVRTGTRKAMLGRFRKKTK